MKAILSFWRHHYPQRVGIFLIAVALIVGMVACEDGVTEYKLSMAVDPAGGGTATDLTNTSPYLAGTVVNIEAAAFTCYKFINWTTSGGGTFADPNDPTTTFTMPAQSVTVTAHFEPESGGCVGFEDLPLGTRYEVGDAFVDTCTRVAIEPFQLSEGEGYQWWYDGHATVVNYTRAGGSGQEMEVVNVNLNFTIPCPWEAMSLLFGEYGGNLNIEINGDFRNFDNFEDIDGLTIGDVDVDVSVTYVSTHDYIGSLNLSGTINSFSIGGQELYIDQVCITYPFEPTSLCVEFEELLLGTQYDVGEGFMEACVAINVERFQWSNKDWYYGGHTKVKDYGRAGGSGQEMEVNNVNLKFAYYCPWQGLSLLFGDYGGNLNIEINGDFRNFDDFEDIDGLTIGGVDVDVSVTYVSTSDYIGSLTLSGGICSFSIGGQELYVDHVCMNITS